MPKDNTEDDLILLNCWRLIYAAYIYQPNQADPDWLKLEKQLQGK